MALRKLGKILLYCCAGTLGLMVVLLLAVKLALDRVPHYQRIGSMTESAITSRSRTYRRHFAGMDLSCISNGSNCGRRTTSESWRARRAAASGRTYGS
jgi:hypothetical protein